MAEDDYRLSLVSNLPDFLPSPSRGLVPTQRFVLGAVLVYQLALLHRFDNCDYLSVGLKPYLQAA